MVVVMAFLIIFIHFFHMFACPFIYLCIGYVADHIEKLWVFN